MTSNFRGIVDGILSGDSLIIRFLPPCKVPIQIISLEHLVAPKFGLPDGEIKDEPFGYDSWNFLRKLCIGKRVLVSPSFKDTKYTRFHPSFGHLPISFTSVCLYDEEQKNPDVGILATRAGWVKLRSHSTNSNSSTYLSTLRAEEEAAKNAKVGIWSPEQGFVRQLPVPFTDEDIFSQREFKAIVKGVINATTLSLFLLPRHLQVQIQLAGCKPPRQTNDSNNLANEAKQTSIRTFLHREITIRICQKSEMNPNQKGEPSYVGCLIGAPDTRIVKLISDGLAIYYPKTADFAPNADLYIQAEMQAKNSKRNIWANAPATQPKELKEFTGTCTSIRSSSSLFLTNGEEKHIYFLSSVKVPYFFYNGGGGGADVLGFEAREFLRNNYHGKQIRAVPNGYASNRDYATLYCGSVCINEEICRVGLSKHSEPFVGSPSERDSQIKTAEEEAKNKKIGLFADTLPAPITITDISQFSMKSKAQEYFSELQGKTLNVIIEHVAAGSKFHVYIPDRGLYIRTGINGLLPSSMKDKFGNEAKLFCQQNFMQCSAEINIQEIDISGSFLSEIIVLTKDNQRINIGKELIKKGLAEIHPKISAADPELVQLQKEAIANGLGIWGDKTRHLRELHYGTVEKVKVISVWNPITYAIQFFGNQIETIEQTLVQPLNPLSSEDIRQLHLNDCIAVKTKVETVTSSDLNGVENIFRARIESFDETNTKITSVKLIDLALDSKDFTEVFKLPDELISIEPQSRTIRLGCLSLARTDKNEQDVDIVKNVVTDAVLYMHLMYDDEMPNVLLTDKPNVDSGSLNAYLLSLGVGNYINHDVHEGMQEIANQLSTIHPESAAPEENNTDQ